MRWKLALLACFVALIHPVGMGQSNDLALKVMPRLPGSATLMRELCELELANPSTAARIRVTASQYDFADISLQHETMDFLLAQIQKGLFEDDDESSKLHLIPLTPGRIGAHLYRFLAPNQINKLESLVLERRPLDALLTTEVKFALQLTPDQQNRLTALNDRRRKYMLERFSKKAPNWTREIEASLKEIKDGISKQKLEEDEPVDQFRSVRELLRKSRDLLVQVNRVGLEEQPTVNREALAILTPSQRRRYNELAGIAASK